MTQIITNYWLEAICGIVFSGLVVSIKIMFAHFKALKLGLQAMLRNSIIEQYNKYMDRGYVPIYALENVEAMYREYHALGGNGTITQLYEELQELSKRKKESE